MTMLLASCGGESVHGPSSRDYQDPDDFYVPPQRQQAAAKADLLSPNPFIRTISWAPDGECAIGTFAPMRIRVQIDDHDSSHEQLRVEGSISGCESEMSRFGPSITQADSVVTCHHVRDHQGLVTVVDEEGRGDSVIFKFGPCETGEASYMD
ncbi:MAG: hypothetical protein VX589_05410 [Myxococcota bacterium]|nr:hypothetical protein [Myxococcota bacterium]